MRPYSIVFIGLTMLCAVACVPRFPYPYTKAQLKADSRRHPTHALLHYLSQKEADPSVCAGKVGSRIQTDDYESLIEALQKKRISPAIWEACIKQMLDGLKSQKATELLVVLTEAYLEAVEGAAASDATAGTGIKIFHDLIVQRPAGLTLPGAEHERLLEELRQIEADNRLSPTVAPLVSDMREALELESGRWQGKTVTPALLATVDAPKTLERMMRRLPNEELRIGAKRRLLEVRIGRSTIEEVRDDPRGTLERLMSTGVNAIPLPADAQVSAVLEQSTVANWSVWVKQDPLARQVGMFAKHRSKSKEKLLPVIDLRRHLSISVEGISQAITFCGDPRSLALVPCIPSSLVEFSNIAADLDEQGKLRFAEGLTAGAALHLVGQSSTLDFTFSFKGRPIVQFALPIRFEQPQDTRFAAGTGAQGPPLRATMFSVRGRVVIEVSVEGDSEPTRVIVLEASDAPGFSVISAGGQGQTGRTGSPGSDGMAGMRGTSAICPYTSGGAGGAGTTGGGAVTGAPGETAATGVPYRRGSDACPDSVSG